MRALVAVAGRPLPAGTVKGWSQPGFGLPLAYVQALRRAGAQEAALSPVEPDEGEVKQLLARFDALLLVGGGDVDPARYGQARGDKVYGVFPESDAFELALARVAVQNGFPTLAVCRGIQVLNVALGGTLHQDLGPSTVDHGTPGSGRAAHDVQLAQGSRTYAAMGVDRPACSSHHHQALDALGTGLTAVGWSDDGVIEAVEHDDGWIVGVQWHPEDTAGTDRAQQGLFDTLVEQATSK